LLPETPGKTYLSQTETDTITSAEIISERLRHVIETSPIITVSHVINITVSIGVAEPSTYCKNTETLIDFADQALYQVKRRGRNQVVLWTPNNDF